MIRRKDILVDLKLGMTPHQKPFHAFAILISTPFLILLFRNIYRSGFINAVFDIELGKVLIACIFIYFCLFFGLKGYRIFLTDKMVEFNLAYPTPFFRKRAPIADITRLTKGKVMWNRPIMAITVFWKRRDGTERFFYISLDNFPASEVQRLLDGIGERRPDLAIPVVGKQVTALGIGKGPRKRRRRKKP